METTLHITKKRVFGILGEIALVLLTTGMAGMWVFTSVDKIAMLERFLLQLKNLPLPVWTAPVLAWLLPTIGLAVAALMAVPKTQKWGLYGSFALMLSYFIYTLVAVNHLVDGLPCPCMGVKQTYSYEDQYWFNLKALIVALTSILIYHVLTFKKKTL